MAVGEITRYVRPLERVRENMLERARGNRNPFDFTAYEEVEAIFGGLTSLDRDAWAEAFAAPAPRYESQAEEAEAAGNAAEARQLWLRAYGYYRVARYPAPNSPLKRAMYPKSQDAYLRAHRLGPNPIERVVMPFQGRPGEGAASIGLLQRPSAAQGALPVVVLWGGIDSFKEERRTEAYLEHGFATLAIDMPGVGDAPLAGSEDAERLWDGVFDWIETRADLDAARVGLVGGSTGGYWAAKVAHTHPDRVAAAVDQGGCAHFAFTPEWIERSQDGEYPFELAETLACAFGLATFEDWVENAPRFSLLSQGVLDQPCAPLLLINGVNDSVFPIADMYLLLEHGNPKAARFSSGGHMGHTSRTQSDILRFLDEHLRR